LSLVGRFLLAAASIVAATAVVLPATAAKQDQQDDDPAQITAAEAVITKVTHRNTSKVFDAVPHRSPHIMS
jgi:Na+-transporting NADH:ubiquinone oxidoreductase subunit NqrC